MLERTLALLGSARLKPRNRLLAALPQDVLLNLRPYLKPVSLARGRVLCEAAEPLGRAYFVEVGAVSLVTVFEDGQRAAQSVLHHSQRMTAAKRRLKKEPADQG